ncbi:GntR family transcriptional regulator [Streptomyces kronopolitis]|uniref:GntR family transcriptional regulator n=1 Tax=Streptomyces kronopolitis TaxID=1612435 RepID=UPI003D95DD44
MSHQGLEQKDQAVEPSSSAEDTAATRRALRNDLLRLGRVAGAKSAASAGSVLNGHADLDKYAAVWVPHAERRQEAATGSPADRARWAELIKATARPEAPAVSYEGLVVRAGYARELLRALAETLPPWVSIADVAEQIKKRITDGSYPPGAVLAPGRIAADLALPLPSIRLALSDLAAASVVEQKANRRVRVPGGDLRDDRPFQLAETVREFIRKGVFPPGVALPGRQELCRILVTTQPPLAVAMRTLFDEGLLEHGEFQRLTARWGAVQRLKRPTELPRLASDPSLHTDEVREAVRRARSWWKSRLTPTPEALDKVIDQLVAAAHHLVEGTRSGPLPPTSTHQQISSLIARTAVLAAAVHRPDYALRVWHTACLATAVDDLLATVDFSRPADAAAALLSA